MKNKAGHSKDIKKNPLDFGELITLLGKVKSSDDITDEIVDEMLGAALALLVTSSGTEEETSQMDKIKIARLHVMDYFDGLILDAVLDGQGK